MLRLDHLTVRYGRGRRRFAAVNDVSLVVPTGGTLGLVGESGCGKSTIARAVTGLLPFAAGRAALGDDDITAQIRSGDLRFRRRVQMVFQDPHAAFSPRMTIGAMLAEAVAQAEDGRRSHGVDEVAHLLDMVRLPVTVAERYPHQLSGGQRQRLGIARALAVKPEVIITDEVTSALDVSVQGTILNLLREVQAELGISYLFISHDLATVRYMSDAIAVMYLGRIVETAPTEDLFERPSHPYTTTLLESVPELGQPRRPPALSGDLPDPHSIPAGCPFHTRCPHGPRFSDGRDICRTADPQPEAAERLHQAACHFAPSRRGIEVDAS